MYGLVWLRQAQPSKSVYSKVLGPFTKDTVYNSQTRDGQIDHELSYDLEDH